MSVQLEIPLYQTHLDLIDEVVKSGTHGNTREKVLRSAVLEHSSYLLSGGTPHDPAPWNNINIKRPHYGKSKFEQILEPGEGKAIPLLRGEVLHMVKEERLGIGFNKTHHQFK